MGVILWGKIATDYTHKYPSLELEFFYEHSSHQCCQFYFLLQSQNEKPLRFKGLFGSRKRVICGPYFYTSPWWIAHVDYLCMKHSHTNIDFLYLQKGKRLGGVKKLYHRTECIVWLMIFWGDDLEWGMDTQIGRLVVRSCINHSLNLVCSKVLSCNTNT